MTENKNLKFKKTIKNNYDEKNPQQNKNSVKKQKIKEILVNKYHLSESEAEEKIILLEKQKLQKKSNKKHDNTKNRIKNDPKQKNYMTYNHKINNDKPTDSRENTKVNASYSINNNMNNLKHIPKPYTPNPPNKQLNINSQEKKTNETKKDVDKIIENLVNDYNPNVSIELNHVKLTFDIQEDRIDNLKEQIIRTLKRNKSKTTKFNVLNDVSFKIYQGEKVGIIGYNGAGKSTLLKLITGIYKPDEGSVKTYGNISPLLGLGAGFDHNFSGAKNIYLNGAVLGYDKEFIDEKYNEIIEFAELGKFINIPIRNYSSGMLAKLGFSIATIVNPDILIIDEILGVGDVNFQRKSRDKMKSLMGGKTTVLLVSHSINQIRELCDKAIWIDNGKVREIGDVNAVCDHYIKDSQKATKEQLKNIQFN